MKLPFIICGACTILLLLALALDWPAKTGVVLALIVINVGLIIWVAKK